jgi:hypothetical protein
MRRVAAALLFALCSAGIAAAQDSGAPQPIVRATLKPDSVLVGRPVTLEITVLAPNYLTGPPEFPDIQLNNAVTRPLGSGTNLSEEHQGTTYAGVMHEYAIYPQEPGAYAITGRSVTFTYAIDPPRRSPPVTLPLPDLAFTATIPDAAQGLDPFLASTRLTLRQSVDPQPGDLKVGDSLARTITVEAADLPAMLLPPVRFAAIEGLSVYPDQPQLDDKPGDRGGPSTGTRIDRVTYMLERPGTYELPAVAIAWWNADAQTVETARAETVTFVVRLDPTAAQAATNGAAAGAARGPSLLDAARRWWPFLAAGLVLLGALAWLAPRVVRTVAAWNAARRQRDLASEAHWFHRFRAVTHAGDARQVLGALLAWLDRFPPLAKPATLDALAAASRDPALAAELSNLKAALYAAPGEARASFSARRLRREVGAARQRLRRARPTSGTRMLPPLNPERASPPRPGGNRPPAR